MSTYSAFGDEEPPEDTIVVRVCRGDYQGKTGIYLGREETTGAWLVSLDGDHPRDPPAQVDVIEVVDPTPRAESNG
jgi:hypothetical protein